MTVAALLEKVKYRMPIPLASLCIFALTAKILHGLRAVSLLVAMHIQHFCMKLDIYLVWLTHMMVGQGLIATYFLAFPLNLEILVTII